MKSGNEIQPKVIAGIGEKKSNGETQYYQQDRIYDSDIAISLSAAQFNPYYATEEITTRQVGMLTGGKWDKSIDKSRRVYDVNGAAPTVITHGGGNQEVKTQLSDLRIRKLTPKECWRLMGFAERERELARYGF